MVLKVRVRSRAKPFDNINKDLHSPVPQDFHLQTPRANPPRSNGRSSVTKEEGAGGSAARAGAGESGGGHLPGCELVTKVNERLQVLDKPLTSPRFALGLLLALRNTGREEIKRGRDGGGKGKGEGEGGGGGGGAGGNFNLQRKTFELEREVEDQIVSRPL